MCETDCRAATLPAPVAGRRTHGSVWAIVALSALAGCTSAEPQDAAEAPIEVPDVEAISLLGEPLLRPALSEERREQLQRNLDIALAAWTRTPENPDSIIWLGRRHAYLGQYRDAIEVFSSGIVLHPDDARLYRHRGHRYITVREFDNAIRDLERAAELTRGSEDEIEPDGAPNAYNIPTSTLQGNIWYHLALAHYLKHDFDAALAAWLEARDRSTNDDMLVATSDWLYMTYRRLGRDSEAAAVLEPVHAGMRILENNAYHQRLLMYRGEVDAESLLGVDTEDAVQLATYGYGVGNWYFYNGDAVRAEAVFRRIIENTNWAAFGFIAAEAELSVLESDAARVP